MKKKRRPYEELRSWVEHEKGKMKHKRAGYQWGAWIVRLRGKERIFRSNGSGYPELDKLYKPKPGVPKPKHYKDYTNTLLPHALEKFERLLSSPDDE